MNEELKEKKKFNKKYLTFGILGLFALALVTAGLLTYFGQIQQDVTVSQSIKVNGFPGDTPTLNTYIIDNAWKQKYTSKANVLTNDGSRDIDVIINTDGGTTGITTTYDTIGLSTRWSTVSDAFADASLSGDTVTLIADKFRDGGDWSASEARITIDAEDVGVTTLNDLVNMSWTVDVITGYIAHVDVLLDNKETLVFEYAKVHPTDCDDIVDYPSTNGVNTFGDKGIVDSNAKAWLSSGVSGGCQTQAFIDKWKTLADWKVKYPNAKILRFEIEVDGWEQAGPIRAESHISNIVINGFSKEIGTFGSTPTLESGYRETFYVNNVFDAHLAEGTYNLLTTVNLI